MAGIKISDLPAAPSAQMTDVFPVDQGLTTYKESNQQVFSLFQANGTALTRVNDTNVTMTLGGAPSLALLNPTSMTLGWTGNLAVGRGGSGNNTFTPFSVICAGTTATGAFQNVVGLGNAGEQLTSNGAGALPTWQPSSGITPAALTRVDDTNITLTLGGTPSTALLQATSITAGWAGQLSLARGGTNKNITPDNGALVYCDADSFELLAATATAGQIPRSGANAAPTWSTATYPAAAGSSGNVLASDGTNWVSSSSAGIGSPLTTKGDLYTYSTVNTRLAVGTINGQMLQVNSGAATGLAWSTPTYPSASGTAGFILRSDGTNIVYSQATYPDLVGVNTILFGSAANTVGPIAAAQNGVLVSSNTNVPSMLAGPGVTGKILQSNAAAAPSFSTATYPSTAGTSGNVLTSDGTNWNSTALTSFTSIVVQEFTATGTYTPTAGMKFCIVELVAGGGGGGGCATGSGAIYVGSAGGGAGGYARVLYTAAQIGASKAVTIGAAGTAGATGSNNGGTGGTTTFGATLVSCTGGVGGGFGTVSSPGDPGAGGTPTITSGTRIATQIGMAGCFGYTNGAGSVLSCGGNGGSSPFGGGGRGQLASSVGSAGNGFGSGGSGSSNIVGTSAGSAGAAGFLVVTEYI